MLRTECTFCDHVNPPQSKFCNACGAPLHLTLCPNCDALNDKTASACYKCDAVLPSSRMEALALSSAAQRDAYFSSGPQIPTSMDSADSAASTQWDGNLAGSSLKPPARPPLIRRALNAVSSKADFAFAGSRWPTAVSAISQRSRSRVVLGTLGALALAGAGLYAYFAPTADGPKYPAAVAERGRAPVGMKSKGATSRVDTTRSQEDTAHELESSEVIPSQSSAAAVPIQKQNADAGGGAQTQPPESCTQVPAALGLCSPQSVQGR